MKLLSDVLLLNRISNDELEFLLALIRWKGINAAEWVKSSGFPTVPKDTLIWKKDASPSDNLIVKDWSRESTVLGRFDVEEKNAYLRAGVTRVYDLNFYPLDEFPLQGITKQIHPEILILTKDENLFFKFRSLLKACGSNAHWCKDIIGLPNMLKETKPGVLLLDAESFPARELSEKLRMVKGNPHFPLCFCLIDFDRENVYQDLTRGLKDLAKAFFEPKDLLIFLRDRLLLSEPCRDSEYQAINWGGTPRSIRDFEFSKIPEFPGDVLGIEYLRKIHRLFAWFGDGAARREFEA
ncbi:hypothetical protein CH373_11000 [Leptospira perolatii]|uniref:Uncharacterized protein n=1 Tax=Leptospira perolatii TaxID=2023191 RepID=A0A2M9ZLR5_9LEPT|nr:hypothetical protein [Leptospira perolatii]PJZ69763.1 hypothetical protein CH360_09235 [Leptospira perolatii]PJZ73022.1 hypothetical protein CH373_11000 [Leptospira perolatii]